MLLSHPLGYLIDPALHRFPSSISLLRNIHIKHRLRSLPQTLTLKKSSMSCKAAKPSSTSVVEYSPLAQIPTVRRQRRLLTLQASLCVFMCLQGYSHIYSDADRAVRNCLCVLFCFCHERLPTRLLHQHTQPQQKFSLPIRARSIIHTAIEVEKAGEGGGGDGGSNRREAEGKLVFSGGKKALKMEYVCAQWQESAP